MAREPHDPRSEAEKARADLKRNSEMGVAVSETPLTEQPSVTADTFGEHWRKARLLSGTDQGVEAGGPPPAGARGVGFADNGPAGPGGSVAEAEQVTVGRDRSRPVTPDHDADALSRAKE